MVICDRNCSSDFSDTLVLAAGSIELRRTDRQTRICRFRGHMGTVREFTTGDGVHSQLHAYSVAFHKGPLGLNLQDARVYGIEGAVVCALDGQAKLSGLISVGSILSKVNETDVLSMPYMDVISVVRSAATSPILQFVPKHKILDIQRSDEIMPIEEEQYSLMQDVIKQGVIYQRSRVLRSWKLRLFVLSEFKLEYYKGITPTAPQRTVNLSRHRCSIRALPGRHKLISRSPLVTAEFLLELRIDRQRWVMAFPSKSDQQAWLNALNLVFDASTITHQPERELDDSFTKFTESNTLTRSTASNESIESAFLSQLKRDALCVPIVHVCILSVANLSNNRGYSSAYCEVTAGNETFQTSMTRYRYSPVWKQDRAVSFEVSSSDMVVEISVFDKRRLRSAKLIATLTLHVKSLPCNQKTTREFPLTSKCDYGGATITLSLEYANKGAVDQQCGNRTVDKSGRPTDVAQDRDREKLRVENAVSEAARAREAAMKAKQEADIRLAKAREALEKAQLLTSRIQRSTVPSPSVYVAYRGMIHEGHSDQAVMSRMRSDGIHEIDIQAFFRSINSFDERIRALQTEVENLKRDRPVQEEEAVTAPALPGLENLSDQVKMFRRLLKLEKQLQQAGMTVESSIPFQQSLDIVQGFSRRLGEMESVDIINADPATRAHMREAYCQLERDVENFSSALLL